MFSVHTSSILHDAICVVLLVHSTISGRDNHPIERKQKKKKKKKKQSKRKRTSSVWMTLLLYNISRAVCSWDEIIC
jgi:hypothetical protein